MKMLKCFFSFTLLNLATFVLAFFNESAHAAPPMPRDPYSSEAFQIIKNYFNLNNGLPHYHLDSVQVVVGPSFQTQTARIKVEGYPDLILVLKLPKIIVNPLPAVVLFSGFQTGAQAVNLVGDPNSLIFVGFEYPWPIDFTQSTLNWDWKRMEVIPIMMAVALKWLHEQSWINSNKINVVTVSFGTLFYPLAQRLLNENGIYPRTTVFGYGGVDLAEVIGSYLQNSLGQSEVFLAKIFIQSQTWFIEPKYHLSQIKGPFLIVNGDQDTVFPKDSKDGLIERTADPKKMVTLPGGHIQPDKPEIINQFMSEVFSFFMENQAL